MHASEGSLINHLAGALRGACSFFEGVGGDAEILDAIQALISGGAFAEPGIVRTLSRRLYATSKPEGFMWVMPAGNTTEYLMPRLAEMLPVCLGCPLSAIWAKPVAAGLAKLGEMFMSDPTVKPEDARKALDAAVDKPLRKALEKWLLHDRQASGVIHEVIDPHALEDVAVFPAPTTLFVGRKMHPLPIPDVDVLTSEMVAQDFFIGDDPERPRMPGGFALIDAIAAARFAPDRRNAFVWMHLPSSFGKGMFLGALADIGVLAQVSQAEIEKAVSGAAVGIEPRNLLHAWVLAVNEFHGLKRELKELENTLRCAPKYKSTYEVPVYMKIFLSAEDNLALTGAGGVESQYVSRFTYLHNKDGGTLDERPLMGMLGRTAYRLALAAFIGRRLWGHVMRYRDIGPAAAGRVAGQELDAFWQEMRIDRFFLNLDTVLGGHADDFAQWSFGMWQRGNHHRAGFDVVTCMVRGVDRMILTSPVKAFTEWLASPGHDPAFRATIGKRRRDILDRLDYGTHRAGDKVVKGCALPFADPTKNLPEAVRLVVDNAKSGT